MSVLDHPSRDQIFPSSTSLLPASPQMLRGSLPTLMRATHYTHANIVQNAPRSHADPTMRAWHLSLHTKLTSHSQLNSYLSRERIIALHTSVDPLASPSMRTVKISISIHVGCFTHCVTECRHTHIIFTFYSCFSLPNKSLLFMNLLLTYLCIYICISCFTKLLLAVVYVCKFIGEHVCACALRGQRPGNSAIPQLPSIPLCFEIWSLSLWSELTK